MKNQMKDIIESKLLINNKEYLFIETGIYYEIIEGNKIKLYIDCDTNYIDCDKNSDDVVRLYNEGFNTGVKLIKKLNGKQYVWKHEENKNGDEAGWIYHYEHNRITASKIKIFVIDTNRLAIKWVGYVEFWDDENGEIISNVPFEANIIGELKITDTLF